MRLERGQVERLLAHVDESERVGQLELTLPKVRALCEGWLAQQDAIDKLRRKLAREQARKRYWRDEAIEARDEADLENERGEAFRFRVAAQQRVIDAYSVFDDVIAMLSDARHDPYGELQNALAALLSINEEQDK